MKRFRPFSTIAKHTSFSPEVSFMRDQIELQLSVKQKDLILFENSKSSGLTDLAFEKRESKFGTKRMVSMYFKMDREGIQSYRKLATVVRSVPTSKVEMFFTPHLGQSRISFEWDTFWSFINDDPKYMGSETLLKLTSGRHKS